MGLPPAGPGLSDARVFCLALIETISKLSMCHIEVDMISNQILFVK